MDECDLAQRESDNYLNGILAGCRAARVAAADGRCRVCGEKIPPKRLATGAATCIACQEEIEAAACRT